MRARIPTREIAEDAKFRKKSARNNDRFLNYAHRSIVLSVRDNAGFGATRLSRVFDPFVADWRRLMARYLHKDREGLVVEMRRMLDRYNACPVFPSEYTL